MYDITEQVEEEYTWIQGKVLQITEKVESIESHKSNNDIAMTYYAMASYYAKVSTARKEKNYNEFFRNMETLKGVCGSLIRSL